MREGQPSSTAVMIAAEVALLSRDPRLASFVPPGAGELSRAILARAAPWVSRVIERAHHPAIQRAARFIEAFYVRGLALQHNLRKRWVEDRTREALQRGKTQVVVVAAGLDTLSLRLASESPAVQFIEVDHPATQRVKTEAMPHGRLPDNIAFVPADLSRVRLDDALARRAAWNPLAPTLFIAEGLTMYLEEAAVERLLSSVRGPTGAQRRLIFTFMQWSEERGTHYLRATPLLTTWLRLKGELFRWGLRPEDAESWLQSHGFHLRELVGAEDLRRLYLAGTHAAGDPLAVGEWLSVADAVSGLTCEQSGRGS